MSAATDSATARFATAVRPAWDLIAIHKRNPNQGLRVADLSLNRGVIVFAVAAWQTFVEQLALGMLEALAPPVGDPGLGLYRLIAANIRDRVRRLNVPDSAKTIDLLLAVGFNPEPAWHFSFYWERQRSVAMVSIRDKATLNPAQARRELDSCKREALDCPRFSLAE